MKQKKKLAIVYDVAYPWVVGGAERRNYEIARRLTDEYEIHFFCMKFWEGPAILEKEGMFYHGVCKVIPLHGNKRRTRSVRQAVYFALKAYRKLMDAEYDILDCTNMSYFAVLTARIVTWRKRLPLYATWHEVWGVESWKAYFGVLGLVGASIEQIIIRLPDHLISGSSLTTQRLKEILGDKKSIVTVPSGIDKKVIQNAPQKAKKFDVVFSGRLVEHKHVRELVKAIAILNLEKPTTALIIGDGPEKKDILRLIKLLKMEKQITVRPFEAKHSAVYTAMKNASVYVLPSTREGFGIVVVEAIASGTPVVTIATEDNAAQYLVTPGKNGFLCSLTAKDLAKTIRKTMEQFDTPTARAKLSSMVDEYDWDRIAKQYREALH